MQKLPAPLVLLSLSVALMAAVIGFGSSVDGAAPHIVSSGPMTLRLSSTMAGVTFNGDTLVCPPMTITTSSGVHTSACEFTIASIGTIQPDSVAVSMSVTGITAAEAAASKFAIDPQPGALVYLQTTSQTVYTFKGAELPATIDPGLVWGANAGSELDDSDLGATLVVTYTVVAESLAGATATPIATTTPYESIGGETDVPRGTYTPPPTASAGGFSSNDTTPLFAVLICLLLGGIGLVATRHQRRSVRR